jgi:PAS domain S-box-containing protein
VTTRSTASVIANEPELLRSFANDSPLGFVALRPDGTIAYVSASIENLLGGVPSDYLGTNVVDLLHPDDVERAVYQLATTTGWRTPGITRFKVRHRDGSWRDIEIFGSWVSNGSEDFLGIYARDGQNQIFLEDLLTLLLSGASRTETLTLVLNTVQWHGQGSGVAISYVEDGRLVNVSTGLPDALAGSTDDDTPWSRCRRTLDGVEGAAEDLEAGAQAMAVAAGLDQYWVEPVDWAADQVPATVTIWTAIGSELGPTMHSYGMGAARYMTEMILRWTQQSRDLHRATEQLVAQEKLASLGTLTAGVAHEVRNPLSFVKNFSDAGSETVEELVTALGAGSAADPAVLGELVTELANAFAMVSKHATRIDAIVSNMLGYSQGSGRAEETDMAELLRTFVDLGYQGYRGSGHPDFHAEVVVDSPPVTAAIHPQEIGRVIVNLVTNACAAMEELGGQGIERGPVLKVTLTTPHPGELCVAVTDNGTGIPPDVAEHIFDPFFTTKAPGEGTGLGLGLCHDIVVGLHGGRMDVVSDPGSSTTASFTLPIARPTL